MEPRELLSNITEFPTPPEISDPDLIALGSDGNFWFTSSQTNEIGIINPTTHVVAGTTPISTPNAQPYGIAAGPDGNLWFTEFVGNKIGMINPTARVITSNT